MLLLLVMLPLLLPLLSIINDSNSLLTQQIGLEPIARLCELTKARMMGLPYWGTEMQDRGLLDVGLALAGAGLLHPGLKTPACHLVQHPAKFSNLSAFWYQIYNSCLKQTAAKYVAVTAAAHHYLDKRGGEGKGVGWGGGWWVGGGLCRLESTVEGLGSTSAVYKQKLMGLNTQLKRVCMGCT